MKMKRSAREKKSSPREKESKKDKTLKYRVRAIVLIFIALTILILLLIRHTGFYKNFSLQANMNPFMFLLTITILALADSINPCMISLMIIMLANLASLGLRKRDLIIRALVFTIVVYITYFVLGVLIYLGYSYLYSLAVAVKGFNIMKLFLVIVLLISGVINLKDAFTKSRSIFSIPETAKPTIEKLIHYVSIFATVLLAIFVTIVELPCTGIFYLGLISYMHSNLQGMYNLLIVLMYYNLLFIIPEILIAVFIAFGLDPKEIYETFYRKNRTLMRVLEGLVLIALGLIVWFFVNIG